MSFRLGLMLAAKALLTPLSERGGVGAIQGIGSSRNILVEKFSELQGVVGVSDGRV